MKNLIFFLGTFLLVTCSNIFGQKLGGSDLEPIYTVITEDVLNLISQNGEESNTNTRYVKGQLAQVAVRQKQSTEETLQNNVCAKYVVGGKDLQYYYYVEVVLPECLRDFDGGTVRFIMQHETNGHDQVRIIDAHIGTEYDNDKYGARGRYIGRAGWTRQLGGGDYFWVLGDAANHNVVTPWNWAWITDYRWLDGNTVLGGEKIRIYSHPHVTTRVIFYD